MTAQITIFLDGGVIQDMTAAAHNETPIRVIVQDYDIEGLPEGDITCDPEGEECYITEWNLNAKTKGGTP